MSTWTREELDIAQEYLQQHQGVLTAANYEEVAMLIHQTTSRERSANAVKVKVNDIRRANRAPEISAIVPEKWSDQELERLATRYAEMTANTKTGKIRGILADFPGRSEKAIVTVLREKFPVLYHQRTQSNPSRVLTQVSNITITTTPERTSPSTSEQTDTNNNINTYNNNAQPAETTNVLPTESLAPPASPEVPDVLRRRFKAMLKSAATSKRLIKKPSGAVQAELIATINELLREQLSEINASTASETSKRKNAKLAIYTAGILLTGEHKRKTVNKAPQNFEYTRRKIESVQRQLERARKLREYIGGRKLSRELQRRARELRKTRMTPTQAIKLGEERLQALTAKYEMQLAKAEALGVRVKFHDKPAMNTIAQRTDRPSPDPARTTMYYRSLFAVDPVRDRRRTPMLSRWLERMHDYYSAMSFEQQVSAERLARTISRTIKKSAPWKASGLDRIPTALYKLLPAAREFLTDFIVQAISGQRKVQEADIRARVILVHKAGDTENPANYRPIAVLNAIYKILSAVLSAIVSESLADWMIPRQ
ncbi:hypothetical protein TKK_0005005 [Trichogramma kaykai]|uniref:Reverse transcriptase domain-containing protein n=1 Tax=Trichogramma kaykai TaxID=54128 RepID=A0ABD2XIW7_9HYME